MSDIVQRITFVGAGLNTDDSQVYMASGDAPYRLHCAVSEDGLNGVLTFMKGNKQVDYISDLNLANTYFVLGSYYNELTRKCYYFIFSQPFEYSTGLYRYDNRLLCLNEDALTVDTIFLDTKNYFGLDPTQHLTGLVMLGSWLYFNPVTDEPKMIDVDMAYNYTNYTAYDDTDTSFSAVRGERFTWRGGLWVTLADVSAGEDPTTNPTKWERIGNSYQDDSTIGLTDFSTAFLVIKPPPSDRISAAYGSDATKVFNNIRGRMFRFCHRYQYFDDSYSVFSSFSNVTRPVDDEAYNGELPETTTENNFIRLSYSLYSSALIKNVELYFQEIDGDWKRITIINRQDVTLLDTISDTFDFYNNETYSVVPTTLVNKIYDAVPKRAADQEIINKNVLCYAKCTEGFDNLDKGDLDVTLTPVLTEIETVFTEKTLRWNLMTADISYNSFYDDPSGLWYYYTIIDIGTNFAGKGLVSGDVFRCVLGGLEIIKPLVAGDVDTAVHLASAISGVIQNSAVYNAGGILQVQISANDSYPLLTVARLFEPETTYDSLTKQGGFKTASYHPFCRFYYDKALRRSDVQVGDGMAVYVPSFNEESPPLTNTNYKYAISWQVDDEPMEDMVYWRWGYAGNTRCSQFTQYIVKSVANSTPTDEDTPEDVANTVKIDISPLQTIRTTVETDWNCFPNSVIPQYQFEEGDRIRFMTESTTPSTPGTIFGDLLVGTYDYEILKFDDLTHMIYIQGSLSDLPTVGENTLVEIYTPRKDVSALDPTQTLTYYEFGDLMKIIEDADGNKVHSGITQNQALGTSPVPATGTFYYGDVYHILRTPSKPLGTATPAEKIGGAYHETMGWSDFYDSDDWDRGKLGLESPIGEVTLNIIRHSNVYLQNTKINGLSTFDANNYKELNDTFGDIVAIVEVGDTLKCYQEKKPSSIQIGRTEYFDADGRGQAVQTQSFILGSIRYSPTNFGTKFIESIVKNNRYVYGFDIYNGVMWRDSANGVFPISGRFADIGASTDYKMMTYFKNKSKALLESGIDHCHVLTVWDEEFKMLYVVFKDSVNHDNNETIVFHEPSDRWITFADFTYTPEGGWNEMLELTYDIVKGFENGIGYEWDEETRFAVFNIGTGLGTSTAIGVSPTKLSLTATIPTPVITCTADVVPLSIGAYLTVPTPSVHVSWVALDDTDMLWTSTEYTITEKLDVTLTVEGSAIGWIVSQPSWLSVFELVHGTEISVEQTIISGTTLGVAPNSINSGPERTGSLVFGDVYNNTATITVTQQASVANPNVTVQVAVTDPVQPMVIYEASGSGTNSVAEISITFTPDVTGKNYNDSYTLYYTITKNAIAAGNGSITGVRDERANVKSISMTSAAGAGDVIVVYLQYELGIV